MAADEDLFTALKMFGAGVKQYQVQSAIGDANDYVQQLKAADLSDQQKRSELQGLSNQLVMHLSGLGVQSDQVKQAAAAVAPQAFEDADAMHKEALLSGNPVLNAQSQDQKDFEDQNAGKEADPLKALQFNALQDERFTKHMDAVTKSIDPQTTRFGNIAKLQGSNNQIRDVMPLLNDPNQWTPTAMSETIRKLDNVLSQGSATVAGSQELTPKIRAKYQAELEQLITSKPTAMKGNALQWQTYYKDIFSRINKINEGTIQEGQLGRLRGVVPALVQQFPDRKDLVEQSLSNQLGEPVVIDRNTNQIDTQANIDTQDKYAQFLQNFRPNDPRAAGILNGIGADDRNMKRLLQRYPNLRPVWKKLNNKE